MPRPTPTPKPKAASSMSRPPRFGPPVVTDAILDTTQIDDLRSQGRFKIRPSIRRDSNVARKGGASNSKYGR